MIIEYPDNGGNKLLQNVSNQMMVGGSVKTQLS